VKGDDMLDELREVVEKLKNKFEELKEYL